jgi:hypothetical protein
MAVLVAPRYDARIVDAIRTLDDPNEPIAETCRRVGNAADMLGLTRPSYVHVRRLVHEERIRREVLKEVVEHILGLLLADRTLDPYDLADRIRDARPRQRTGLVAQSHKAVWVATR